MPSPVTIPVAFRRRGPRVRARVLAVAGVLACTTGPLLSATPAAAEAVELRLVNQPFAVVGQTRSRFVFEAVPGATARSKVTVAVHPPVVSRSALRSIASGEVGLRTNVDVVSASYGDLARSADGRILMPVEFNTDGTKTAALDLRRQGVHPVTVSVADGAEVLATTVTFIARSDPPDTSGPAATPVTFMVGSSGPLTHTATGDSAVTDAARAEFAAILDMATGRAAGVSPLLSPETLDAFGTSPDPRDLDLLARARSVFAGAKLTVGTFAPVDVSRLVAEGVSPELVAQYRLAEDVLTLHLSGVRFARGVHVARHPLTTDGARAVADLGLRTVVFTVASVAGVEAPPRPGVMSEFTLPGAIRMRALRTVTGLEDVLATDGTAGGIGDVRAGARLAAELLAERGDLLAEGRDPSTLHLVVDATAAGTTRARIVSVAATFVAQIPEFRPTELSAAVDPPTDPTAGTSPLLTATPEYPPRLMGAVMFTLNSRRDAVVSMLPPDDPRPARWATTLGIIPALEPDFGLESWSSQLQGELDAITSAVSVTATSDITLGSRSGTIRVRLRNESDTALTVRVKLASAKLRFPGGPQVVTLPPGNVTDVDIKVTARSNGRFPVTMSVVTPQGGRQIVAPITLTARVTALAGIGQLVSVTVALVLGAWWFSHWRRGRSRTDEPVAAH